MNRTVKVLTTQSSILKENPQKYFIPRGSAFEKKTREILNHFSVKAKL